MTDTASQNLTASQDPAASQTLNQLRQLSDRLFEKSVTDQVKKLDAAQRQEFVDQRLNLSEAILRLETAQLAEIRQALESHSAELGQGIEQLTKSLSEIEEAAAWAQGLGKVLSVVSKFVPVL